MSDVDILTSKVMELLACAVLALLGLKYGIRLVEFLSKQDFR